MGNMQAQEFAGAVESGEMSLGMALTWHLTSNHFPPIHRDFIPVAKEAIERANEGDWDHEILMPNGLTRTVSQIVEGLHLDSFLSGGE